MTALIDTSITDAAVREPHARQQMLRLIEDAMRDEPYCDCGAPMTIGADGDTLWLECHTFTEPSTGRLARLRSSIRVALHRRSVIARGIGVAA
jgi:hypothetical protein